MSYRWTLTDLSTLDSVVLDRDPIGWDEGSYRIGRDPKYKGIFQEYSTSLRFHCNGGGKDFIDTVYNRDDIDGRIDLTIEYKCNQSGSYETLLSGIIALATYSTDGEYTTVQIEKSDLLTKLMMRDDINVNLESTKSIGEAAITAPSALTLTMPSTDIKFYDEWVTEDTHSYTINGEGTYGGGLANIPLRAWSTLQGQVTAGDMRDVYPVPDNTDYGHSAFIEAEPILTPLLEANEPAITYPITVNWEIDWHGTFTDNTDAGDRDNVDNRLFLVYGVNDGAGGGSLTFITLLDIHGYDHTSDPNYSYDFDIVDSGSITLNAGDSMWLAWYVEDTAINSAPFSFANTITWAFDQRSTFKINTTTTARETVCKTFQVHEVFNQVVDSIADSDGNFYSEFFGRTDSEKQTYSSDGCGSHLSITNGLNIREFDTEPIYCSLSDLFSSMDAIHNIGLGIVSGKIRVEPLSYWFDNTKLLTCANVNQYRVINDNKKYINRVQIGYERWESEFHGGLDDPNAKHEYSTKISSAKNELTKLCKFISSTYSIEFSRRINKIVDSSKDWRYDNENFLVSIVPHYRGGAIFRNSISTIFIRGNLPVLAGDVITVSQSVSNNTTFTVSSVTHGTDEIGDYTRIVTTVAPVTELADSVVIENNGTRLWGVELYGDSFTNGANMTALTTAYNLRITPARMLLAHMNVITAGLQKVNGLISFVRGDGNTELTTQLSDNNCQADYNESIAYVSNILAENQDFDWNDANVHNITPIYLPEIYEFEYPITYAEFKTIQANPYGYVEFYKKSTEVFQGWVETMDYTLKTGMAKFKLLKKA